MFAPAAVRLQPRGDGVVDFRRSSTAGTLGERWRVRLGLLKKDGFTKPPPVPSS